MGSQLNVKAIFYGMLSPRKSDYVSFLLPWKIYLGDGGSSPTDYPLLGNFEGVLEGVVLGIFVGIVAQQYYKFHSSSDS